MKQNNIIRKTSDEKGKHDFLLDILQKIEIDKMRKYPFNSRSNIGYYLTWYYFFAPEEYACAVYLDEQNHYIDTSPLQTGDCKHTDFIPDKIASECKLRRAHSFIVAHNHKNKPLTPSPEDIATTNALYSRFKNENIKFTDHYIVSGFDYVTLLSKTLSERRYDVI